LSDARAAMNASVTLTTLDEPTLARIFNFNPELAND
jgi:hypothetical protein